MERSNDRKRGGGHGDKRENYENFRGKKPNTRSVCGTRCCIYRLREGTHKENYYLINIKDVITLRVPYPDATAELAKKSHMYICVETPDPICIILGRRVNKW